MALTHQPGVRRWFAPGPRAWPLAVAGLLVVAVIVVIATAGCREAPSASSTGGSGVSVTDHRDVSPFARVELAGANTVEIHVGAPLSVAVTGDDNLVRRVTTVVAAGRLVIDNTGSFTTKAPMHVAVSVPSLHGVELGGAGTVTADGVTSADFSAELAGDGTLVVSGTVRRVTAVLAGAGDARPARPPRHRQQGAATGHRHDPGPCHVHARRDADRHRDDPLPGRPDGDDAQQREPARWSRSDADLGPTALTRGGAG